MTGRRLRWAVIETEVEPPETLLGRDEELARCETLLTALVTDGSPSPRALLVAGEAGIGKTTLVRALVDRSRQAGAVAGVGHCVDVSGALPFGPVLEAAYQLAGPDLALLDTSAPNALGLLVNAFSDLTDRAPAVLVLEDLQWADQYTVDFARAFVRSSRARALLVMTYRSDDAAPALRDALVDLRRADGVTHLPLGPLPPAALGDLATRRLGRDLDGDAMTALFRRSEGNPLYAEEILAAETPGIPASLGDLLTRHVRGLSAETRSLVRLAAVGSSIVDVDSLGDVADVEVERLEAGLREALDANVLVRQGARLAFRHALLRDAVYEDLLPTERARLHERYARVLATRLASRTSAAERWPLATDLAFHAAAAGDRRPRYAPTSTPGRRPDGSGPGPMPRPTTKPRWSCGATCPRPTVRPGSPSPTSPAARRTAYSCCSSRSASAASCAPPSRCSTTRPTRWRPAASTPWSRACRSTRPMSLATRRPPPARLRWPARPPAANGSTPGSQPPMPLNGGSATPRCSTRSASPEQRGLSSETRRTRRSTGGWTARRSGTWVARPRRSTASGWPVNSSPGTATTAQRWTQRPKWRGCCIQSGNLDEGVALDRSLRADAEHAGLPVKAAMCAYDEALALVQLGQLHAARTLFEEIRSRGLLEFRYHELGSEVHLALGDIEQAWQHDARTIATYADRTFMPNEELAVRRAAILGARGDSAAEAEWADRFLVAVAGSDSPLLAAVGAYLGLRVPEIARSPRLTERAFRALELARALRAPSWDGTWHAAYLHYAEAFAARLDGRPALEEWAAGVERAKRFGAYVALQPRLELAVEHLRAGDRATGKEQLVAVWADAREMGAGWYERRAAALATRNRVPLPVEEEAAGPLNRLTAREREVLALLTDGATDREIAATLVISPRTASIHVGNILAKLDVPNRGAAAALARDLG